jgi:high-affinity Fe2+/Pb2+ permease
LLIALAAALLFVATAAAQQVPNWVPVTLGSAGGTICALLLLDLLRRS